MPPRLSSIGGGAVRRSEIFGCDLELARDKVGGGEVAGIGLEALGSAENPDRGDSNLTYMGRRMSEGGMAPCTYHSHPRSSRSLFESSHSLTK